MTCTVFLRHILKVKKCDYTLEIDFVKITIDHPVISESSEGSLFVYLLSDFFHQLFYCHLVYHEANIY